MAKTPKKKSSRAKSTLIAWNDKRIMIDIVDDHFDRNGYTVEVKPKAFDQSLGVLAVALGKHVDVRMVKREEVAR